jgi:tetratricopeptide (TPR) repeat protein
LTAYRRAVSADPLSIRSRVGVIEALIALQRFDDALLESRQLVKLPRASVASGLQLAGLLIQRNLGQDGPQADWEEAESVLESVRQAVPDSVEAALLQAQCLAAQREFQDAKDLLQEAQASNPTDVRVRIMQAGLAQREDEWDRAQKILDQAEGELEDSIALRLARAAYLVRRRGSDSAGQLRALADDAGQFPEADQIELWRGLAIMSLRIGDDEQAIDHYQRDRTLCQQICAKDPNNLSIRLLRFDLAIGQAQSAMEKAKEPKQAAEQIPETVEAESAQGQSAKADRDRAAQAVRDSLADMNRVLSEIEKITGKGALWHFHRAVHLGLLGDQTEEEGEGETLYEQAYAHLLTAEKLRPRWSRVATRQGRIAERLGKGNTAIEKYLYAVELGESSPEVLRHLFRLLYQQERYPEAERVIRRLEQRPDVLTPELGRLASQTYFQLERYEQALGKAEQAAANSSDYRDHVWFGLVLEAAAREAQGEERASRLEKAEKELRDAVQLAGDVPDPWVTLVGFLLRNGKAAEAEQAVQELEKAVVPGPGSLLATAHCYQAMGRREEAQKRVWAMISEAPTTAKMVRWFARRISPRIRDISCGGMPLCSVPSRAWRSASCNAPDKAGKASLQRGMLRRNSLHRAPPPS